MSLAGKGEIHTSSKLTLSAGMHRQQESLSKQSQLTMYVCTYPTNLKTTLCQTEHLNRECEDSLSHHGP